MNRNTGACLALVVAAVLATGMPRAVRAAEDPVALQRRLQEIQDQIAADQAELKQAQGQANTLANAIGKLAKQQALLALQIQASDIQLAETEARQDETQQKIDENVAHRERLRTGMAESLRMMREIEEEPPFMVLLRTGDLFAAIEAAHQQADLVGALVESNGKAEELDAELLAERAALEQVAEDARNLQQVRALQQGEIAASKGKQQTLLSVTKGKEEAYAVSIADNKAAAAEIRQRIYDLLGVGTKVTFGEAVKMAQWVASATGIRPAFLLSVLTQESNLGANVGTCNRPGDPASKGWRVIMKPERDQGPFKDITSALGRNPDITPVSCPMRDAKGKQVGWGGAMGPAQFIPSTWVGYQKKVSALTGHAADPWDIRDAFAASAIKLVADGAGSPSGEWAAAMRYFSGSTDSRFRFYGDQVMDRALGYQKDIDAL